MKRKRKTRLNKPPMGTANGSDPIIAHSGYKNKVSTGETSPSQYHFHGQLCGEKKTTGIQAHKDQEPHLNRLKSNARKLIRRKKGQRVFGKEPCFIIREIKKRNKRTAEFEKRKGDIKVVRVVQSISLAESMA